MKQYQETMCEKDVVWAGALAHLRDFLKKAFIGIGMNIRMKEKGKIEKKNKCYTQKLSNKQKEVKRLVKDGLSFVEIARELGIKEKSARMLEYRLRHKLGLPIRKYNKKEKK